jgi:hypothetical protein
MYTYLDYETFVQCNIVTMKHYNIENYNGLSTRVQFSGR